MVRVIDLLCIFLCKLNPAEPQIFRLHLASNTLKWADHRFGDSAHDYPQNRSLVHAQC